MNLGFLHQFRILVAAIIGLCITLATVTTIFFSFKVDPKTVHLSERIHPERTLFYLSSTKREIFFESILRYESYLGENKPTDSNIEKADRYEFALLRTQSGGTAWIFYGRNEKEGKHTTVVSSKDASVFLPLNERRSSLARTRLFSYIPTSTESFAWFDIESFPLPLLDNAKIVQAILSPYKEGILILDAPKKGRLILSNKKGVVASVGANEHNMPDAPLLGLALKNPRETFRSIQEALKAKDEALQEGLQGIMKAKMQNLTNSSDIEKIMTDVFTEQVNITIQRGTENNVLFSIVGTASNTEAINTWTAKIASVITEGNVRKKVFYDDEYIRTDIIAETNDEITAGETYKNWSFRKLGGSGTAISLMIGLRGKNFVIGSNETMIKNSIDNLESSSEEVRMSGTTDIAWLSAKIDETLPFLSPIRETTEAIFGASPARLTWRISPITEGINVSWTLTHAVSENSEVTLPLKTRLP